MTATLFTFYSSPGHHRQPQSSEGQKKSPQRKEKSERRMARTKRESGSKDQHWKKGELFFLGSKAIYSLPLLSIHFVPHWPQGEWELLVTDAIHPSVTVLQDPTGFALWGGISQQRPTCDEVSTTSTVWLFPLPPFSRWTDLLSLQRLHGVSSSTAKGRALNIPNKHIQYETVQTDDAQRRSCFSSSYLYSYCFLVLYILLLMSVFFVGTWVQNFVSPHGNKNP